MKIIHKKPYDQSRAVSYPGMGEALDAIMKGFAAQRARGEELPLTTIEWLEKCQAVKEQFPKD